MRTKVKIAILLFHLQRNDFVKRTNIYFLSSGLCIIHTVIWLVDIHDSDSFWTSEQIYFFLILLVQSCGFLLILDNHSL